MASLANPRIRIPAGAAAHEETLELPLSQEYWVTGYMPHLHTRGAAFRYEVAYPGGQRETLLNVPHYDFNWQLQYQTVEPKHLPAGSRLKVTAIYDNSAANPANPDPTRDVRWGPQTWDEMMIGYIEHIVKRDDKDVAQR